MVIGIYGYGNIGRGVELAIQRNPDMELFGVFTRRDPSTVRTLTGAPVYSAERISEYQGQIDVLILCAGSATDLPKMTPVLARDFNVVDSFDTHAGIPAHFAAVDAAASQSGHTALISGGWDPGLFSLARLYFSTVLPQGETYTFWGKGVSQGHSDAVRRIPGVLDARQYTIPIPEAVEAVRRGEQPVLTTGQKHRRECFVVAAEGADRAEITERIVTMPNYFADYETSVTFITAEEMRASHSGMPHGGSVIRSGESGDGTHTETMELSLKLDSNPEFTALVLVALARAVGKLSNRGIYGCKTIFDVAPADLSPLSGEQLRAQLL